MTGASSGAIPTSSYGVNHLATKFVEIDRGDGDGSHRCYEATLTLYVQIPAGVTSQPTFYWSAGGSPAVPLSIVGSKATAVVPWDTCNWSTKGYLSLPNTSMVDGTSFTVSGALSVDLGKPASSASPPGPTSQYGSTIDAATISSVPELSLFGPQLLRLAADDTQLRVIVQSSGEGSAVFALGSSALASVQLRAGGNRIQLPLPAALLRTLRRSSATMLLSMTPVAPDGTTKGSSVTRQVQITRPVKTKVTVKSHVKPVRPKPAKRLHRAK
jgi:hypothetical protein